MRNKQFTAYGLESWTRNSLTPISGLAIPLIYPQSVSGICRTPSSRSSSLRLPLYAGQDQKREPNPEERLLGVALGASVTGSVTGSIASSIACVITGSTTGCVASSIASALSQVIEHSAFSGISPGGTSSGPSGN